MLILGLPRHSGIHLCGKWSCEE